ncbi:GNAT family N-acetyltransferase [Pseudonocardia acaciae]|uniref:GNAT family N-acetyltransferase n=1 Tax=Pseudonocardia acaciae TaxID=551276 RepID=UPI0006869B7A|nr:GNAT family N-acetyltransferase [Pseudonocardia acaciae]
MTGAAWHGEVDGWWADVLKVPADALRAGGVLGLDHLDHVGVVAVAGADAPLVYGPAELQPALRAAVRASDGDGDLLGGELLTAALPGTSRALGPAWYGYATAAPPGGDGLGDGVRPLAEPDLPQLARLREQTPGPERDESGTDGLPAFGYREDGELLAVASLGDWHGMPTIGVLTHPGARGRGLGGRVVGAAVRTGLTRRAVVQYRAWHRNQASIALARRCGFVHYCDGLVIDLGGPTPRPHP